MSWIEKIQDGLTIKTGDKKTYEPLYMYWDKSFEFNFTEYNFPNIAGSYIDRRLKKGDRFSVRIIFQGENHIDVRNDFLKSSENVKAWIISHPFYGQVYCQPTSLSVDSSGLNTSIITGEVIETLSDDYPKLENNIQGDLDTTGEDIDGASKEMFENVTPAPSDQITMQDQLDVAEVAVKDKINLQEQFDEYFDYLKQANSAVINATTKPLAAINTIRNVMEYPFKLKQSVKSRIGMLVDQFTSLGNELIGLVTPNQKKTYEINAGITIKAMSLSAVSPNSESDYDNAEDVLYIQGLIITVFTDYLNNLGTLQSDNANYEDSYIPNFEFSLGIYKMVYLTVSNLTEIALGAKQKRVIILEYDSDPINLTHRFYGLDQLDENLTKFINTNNIGISEMLEIKKERKIVYYV